MEGGWSESNAPRGSTERYIAKHDGEVIFKAEILDRLGSFEGQLAAWFLKAKEMEPVPPFSGGWMGWPWWAVVVYRILGREYGKWQRGTS